MISKKTEAHVTVDNALVIIQKLRKELDEAIDLLNRCHTHLPDCRCGTLGWEVGTFLKRMEKGIK